jgi:hypothetical protein
MAELKTIKTWETFLTLINQSGHATVLPSSSTNAS